MAGSKGKNKTVRVYPKDWEYLRQKSELTGIPMTRLISDIVAQHFKKEKESF